MFARDFLRVGTAMVGLPLWYELPRADERGDNRERPLQTPLPYHEPGRGRQLKVVVPMAVGLQETYIGCCAKGTCPVFITPPEVTNGVFVAVVV